MESWTDSSAKLISVLELFLLPDYKIVSPTYLDILLTRIGEATSKDGMIYY